MGVGGTRTLLRSLRFTAKYLVTGAEGRRENIPLQKLRKIRRSNMAGSFRVGGRT